MLVCVSSEFLGVSFLTLYFSQSSVEICKAHEYEGNGCWVERPDFKPPTEQNKQPGGQTSW